MQKAKLCASIVIHDDHTYLAPVLRNLASLPRFVFASKTGWNGTVGNWEESVRIAEAEGATVIVGDWKEENEHRQAAYAYLLEQGFTHALTVDSDEIIEKQLLEHLIQIADGELADRVYIRWDTYWKSPEYVIRPREPFTPCIMIDLRNARQVHIREYEGGRGLFLNESYGIVHHLSYAGTDERIWKKITGWSHRDEIVPRWWECVWKGWEDQRLMQNIHPTHPESYRFAERIHPPQLFVDLGIAVPQEKPKPKTAKKSKASVSIIIPARGGQYDLDRCLESLTKCEGLYSEIVVIDNGSAVPITVPKGVTLIRNEENLGFSKACNQGISASKGEILLFLNSDTIVPRTGLEKLLESLNASGSIAAAGPYSNNCGHFQRIPSTYTSHETIDLFAEDFARWSGEDIDTDMLVGFCLAVRRRVIDEVGAFDDRFGLGFFEDNDLCYRIRRAGYRMVIAAKAFVHHEGSKTMRRMQESRDADLDIHRLLEENQRKYIAKWREDLESGFASTLSGLGPEKVVFNPERKPEIRREAIEHLVEKADISLCMIAKNEERVIRDCLESAKPFFKEILFLDTGSTDSTVEIAKECGAIVRQTEWPDSFALARTESMQGATGKWIMWLDADDTLPFECGEEIIRAVNHAPEDVIGFVVPVRFVEEKGFGTQVDHVKVFRNWPGLTWEGRIHEQILPELRREGLNRGFEAGGRIARLNAYVLHSGYDTSEAGQAKKRERDEHLLKLDLAERPDHPFVLFNLGMTAHYTGAHEEAVEWFKNCLEHSRDEESHVRKAYALYGASLRILERNDEAQRLLSEGLSKFPTDPEIQFHLAQMAYAEGKHDRAIMFYKKVLEADISGVFTSLDPAILSWKTRHNMALAYLAKKNYAMARDNWKMGLQDSGKPELAMTLFDCAMENDDLPTAKEMLDWTVKNLGFVEPWANMVGRLSEHAGLDPMVHWHTVLHMQPENTGVRKVLARHLLNAGHAEAAIPHLDILQQAGEAEGAYFLGVLAKETGDLEKARAWLEQAHALDPEHSDTTSTMHKNRKPV
ncbi:MAG: glycosyltransferase [Fimbriimonadaceae bacterium]|nr:glycosyltransferase [Fimbriimonadaceae bacterium]